jgi:hypothetical protein
MVRPFSHEFNGGGSVKRMGLNSPPGPNQAIQTPVWT